MRRATREGIDFDVFDSGHAASGTHGLYFQRQVGAARDSESWQMIEGAVKRGGLDSRPEVGIGISIGAIAWRGDLWLYRFRSGLRDAHGRLGRLIFVLVRTERSTGFDCERIGDLLGAADALRGIPLDLAPLEHRAQSDAAVLATQRRIQALLERQRDTCAHLKDGLHIAWTIDVGSGVTTDIDLDQISMPSSPAPPKPRPEPPLPPPREPAPQKPVGKQPSTVRMWPFVAASFAFLGVAIVVSQTEIVTLSDGSRVRVLRFNEVSPPPPPEEREEQVTKRKPSRAKITDSQPAEDSNRTPPGEPEADPGRGEAPRSP
ncbi:MAG: hypothetical protein NTU45_06150 [Planctomycetota bacterium]|nr:hypothetical protein [Planctomycetota bacterium]